MEAAEKIKSRWTREFFTALDRKNEEEKYICDICHKDFNSPSNLSLHKNTHVIERRFKCEPCQVSFNTSGKSSPLYYNTLTENIQSWCKIRANMIHLGHLQKHLRSTSHENRLVMTEAFGIPTTDNPRPYGCPECDVAFRKHGHLAKHLRSKLHILKMESNGLVPEGTYALLEKSGPQIRDSLDTTNCELSLKSLRSIAMTLFSDKPEEPS